MYTLTFSPFMFLVRDHDYSHWDVKNKEIVSQYFKEAAGVLKNKISSLENLSENFTTQDEASTRALLESLFKTRQIWQEEFNKNED